MWMTYGLKVDSRFKMCLNLVLFQLFCSFLVYNVESNIIFKDFNKFINVTDSNSPLDNNTHLKFRRYNFSGPLIPISKQNASEFLNPLSNTHFDFWEICHATFYVSDYHVSIITLNNEFLGPKEVYSKRGLVTWYTSVTDNLTLSRNVIIIVKFVNQFHELFYTTSLWNQKTIFVIVILECSLDIKLEMETLWQFHNIHKYVLMCGEQLPVMYMYRPYIPHKNSKIFEITDITEIASSIIHAVDNLYGLQLRVVLFPMIPAAITDKDGKYVGGADYCSLQVLQQRMNFTSVIYPPTDGKTFPQPGKKLSGSVKDLVTGKADIAFNGHFLQNYGIDEVEMTRYVYMDKLCFVTAMPSFKSHYTVIIHIFSRSVWVCLAIVYFLIIIVYYMILKLTQTKQHKHKFKDLFLHVYAIFIIGASTLKTNQSSQKLLIGAVLLGVMILNNTFQGLLTTVLSRPSRNPFIDTIDQITKSELALQSQHAETLVTDPDILHLLKALRRNKPTTTNFIRLARFPIMHFEKFYTYMSHWAPENVTEHLHTVQECIKSNYLSFVVPRKSPFLNRINKYLLRFQESGLMARWFGGTTNFLLINSFWPVENEQTVEIPPKVITVNDLTAIFYLLVYGLTIATVVFLIESLVGTWKSLKQFCRR